MSNTDTQAAQPVEPLEKVVVRWRDAEKGISEKFPIILIGSVQKNIYYEIWKDVEKGKFMIVEWLFNNNHYYDQDDELCDTLDEAAKMVAERYAAEAVMKLSVLNHGDPQSTNTDARDVDAATTDALNKFNADDRSFDVWDVDTNHDPN